MLVRLTSNNHNINLGVAERLLPFFSKGGCMARTIGLITELEVVNSVLSVAGDSPVSSLADTYGPVAIIREMINNVSRDIQSEQYWFNTEYAVELEPSVLTSKTILPFNILRFEPEDTKYVARGLTVYDREGRTTIIEEIITADISLQLTFDELPQVVRKYIQTRCRIQYNNEYFGETAFKQDLAVELNVAKANLDKENIENEDINMFNSARATNIAFKNRRR